MENDGLVPDNGFSEIEIEFDHVSFSYEGSTASVIDDLSFIIRKGEKIALVGLNGAGKSTLVKLMSGLYLPTSGRVLVNGIDTKDKMSSQRGSLIWILNLLRVLSKP